MRVGFVVYGPLDVHSGGDRYDSGIVDGLEAAGDEVTVVSLPDRAFAASLLDNVSARRRLADLDVDVLVEDERCHPSLSLLNGHLDDVPVVAVVHHLFSMETSHPWRQRLRRAVETRYLRSVDAFVFESEATRGAVAEVTDPTPSVVAPPAGDRFESHGAPLDEAAIRARATTVPLRVVTVGPLEPRSNVHTLLRGLARVSGDWELTVVGSVTDPEYAESVRSLASDLGVADRVTNAGRLSDVALASTLRDAHLFARPSSAGGYGVAAVEAMGFGLPALVSRDGGGDELVTDRRNGFLVDPSDASAVTDAVAPLCRNRERLAALSVAARDRYRRQASWEETAASVRAFLSRVVN